MTLHNVRVFISLGANYPFELLRVGLFVLCLVLIYTAAVRHLWQWWCERKGVCAAASGGKRMARRCILTVAFLGLLCIAYGVWIEPNWLQVVHVRLPSRKLKPGTGPVRIVQVSDIHCDPDPRPVDQRALDLVAAEKPDLIVFTGDAINGRASIPTARRWLRRLAEVAPTYGVLGNWDVMVMTARLDVFNGTGVKELNAATASIRLHGVDLWLAGISSAQEWLAPRVLWHVPQNKYTVFLAHYPDAIDNVANQKIDLYCAGHTHGGQVALPFYGALITLTQKGKQYEAGLYRVDQTYLYVSRGIGTHTLRVRFMARPEITVFDIVPEE